MFGKIDDWLMDNFFEPFSHWFQETTGKTNFFIAKYLFLLECVILLFVGLWACFVMEIVFGFLIFLIYILRTILVIFSIIPECERKSDGEDAFNLMNETMNEYRVTRISQRKNCIFFTFLIIILWSMAVPITTSAVEKEMLMILLALYFIGNIVEFLAESFYACTPLPPGKNKISEWVKGIKKFTQSLIPKPTPVPVPIKS